MRYDLLPSIIVLFIIAAPASFASDLNQQVEAYLVNFKGETGYQSLIPGLAREYERLQHKKQQRPDNNWAVSVAIEPSGRYAMGFGRADVTANSASRHARRFCNEQRKIRAMKAKCRTFAVNSKIHKPYKR